MDDFENAVMNLTDLPQLGDQDFDLMPIRYFRLRIWLWSLTSGLVFLLATSGLMWLHIMQDIPFAEVPKILWVILGLWCVFSAVWGISEFRGFDWRGYALRERDLSYRSGYFFHSYTTLPFNRLQHSEISQGPVARAFQVCTLKLYTAGSSGANLSIAGIDPLDAQRIRDYIEEYAGQ